MRSRKKSRLSGACSIFAVALFAHAVIQCGLSYADAPLNKYKGYKLKSRGNRHIPEETIAYYFENFDSRDPDLLIDSSKSLEDIVNDTKQSQKKMTEEDAIKKITKDDSGLILHHGIRNLYKSQFFTDISGDIDSKKKHVDVTVIERPIVHKVMYRGNYSFYDKQLIQYATIKSDSLYSENNIRKDTRTILQMYNSDGYFNTSVDPKIIKLKNNRINIVYHINEGSKAYINSIRFVGNNSFSSSKLSDVIESAQHTIFSFIQGNDIYRPMSVENDKMMLRQFYLDHGYANAKIIDANAELTTNKQAVALIFHIDEGRKYNFNSVNIKNGIAAVKTSDLNKLIDIKKGEIFSMSSINKNTALLKEHLYNRGYVFADVQNVPRLNDDGTVDVIYTVSESHKMYVSKINIVGNDVTLDKVIRREMKIAEGDPYRNDLVELSKFRIDRLGYVAVDDISPSATNVPDKLDLNVKVKESPAGSINFMAGYSADTGIMGQIVVSNNNLMGTGRSGTISVMRGTNQCQITISIADPWFMNKNLMAGIDLNFNQSYQRGSAPKGRDENGSSGRYTFTSFGPTFKAGYELASYLSQAWRYSVLSERTSGVQNGVSPLINAQTGNYLALVVGHTINYDSRDNATLPTSGYTIRMNNDLAGLGGQIGYFNNNLYASYHKAFMDGDLILNIIGRGTVITKIGGKRVLAQNNYYMGQEQIRGFAYQGLGPRDANTAYGDALGGRYGYAATAEIMFPIGLPREAKVWGVLYNDLGSLWNADIAEENCPENCPKGKDHEGKCYTKAYYQRYLSMQPNKPYLRAAFGIGIKWLSPYGWLGLYWAKPYSSKDYDLTQNIVLSLGANFS